MKRVFGAFIALSAVVALAAGAESDAPFSSAVPPAVFSSSSSADSQCTKWDQTVCVAATQKCTADIARNPDKCNSEDSLCCQYPLYCVDGVCKEDNTDGNCTKDADCLVNFYGTGVHACRDRKCIELGNLGDSCLNDTHCVDGMACVEGKCAGLAENATCVPPAEHGMHGVYWGPSGYSCAAGLVCAQVAGKATYACQKAVATAGAACGVGCAEGMVCNKGTCVARFSLGVDAECDADDACDPATVCDEDGKCATGFEVKLTKCSSDDDCKDGTDGRCELCSHVTGYKYCGVPKRSTDCRAEWKKAYACWEEKGCAPVASDSIDTCAQTLCPAETNAVLSCKSNCRTIRNTWDVCAASVLTRNCPLVPTWARILIAFGILVGIVVIVFVIYAVARKASSKEYAPVSEH